jgi:hypothetical protein
VSNRRGKEEEEEEEKRWKRRQRKYMWNCGNKSNGRMMLCNYFQVSVCVPLAFPTG